MIRVESGLGRGPFRVGERQGLAPEDEAPRRAVSALRAPIVAGLFALHLLAACSRRDEPKVTAPHDPVKPLTEPPRPLPESPMVLSAVDGGPIPPPTTVGKPPPDATVTPSGLATKLLTPTEREGALAPRPTSKVEVAYTGWTTDGKMFDSSITRGESATFPLDGVIPGFREGLLLMREGETRRLWIPGNLAYDASKTQGAPHGMLVFDVKLLVVLP